MSQIFISYSRVDKPFAKTLSERLRRAYSVWYDDSLHGGQIWWDEILRQIDACDAFVYLLSRDSVVSPYCLAELEEAERLQKQILPVLIRARTPIPDRLQRYQYVDMSGGLTVDSISDLRDALVYLIQGIPDETPPPRTLSKPPVPEVLDRPSSGFPWLMLGAGLAIAVVIIALAVLIFSVGEDEPPITPTATTALAQQVADTPTLTETSAPSISPTHTPTPEPSENPTITTMPSDTATIDVVAVVSTLDAEGTAAARLTSIAATYAQATAFIEASETAAAGMTQTAAQWTDTPTPDITASVNAFLTLRADEATATEVAAMTLTAESWTDTPTATLTLSKTPTATLRPSNTPTLLLTPRELAERGVDRNADWTPYIEEFNGVEMVLVPAGCFMMGNDDYALAELPVHEQCFEQPFWIDRYEVTNEQYGSIGCVESSSEPNQPRNCVDWIDATAHCENRGARLPTEREWEYGARGPDNFTYPWGNAFAANSVVFLDNAGVETASVGSRPNGLSWVGAFDMAGNLWEWMSTIFYDYPYVGDDGREDRNNINEGRVLRGGSFINGSSAFRAAMRGWNFPNGQDNETGFRCARSY